MKPAFLLATPDRQNLIQSNENKSSIWQADLSDTIDIQQNTAKLK